MPEVKIVTIDIDADIEALHGPMEAWQRAIVARLKQESHYPAALAILYEQKLNIEYEVEEAVGAIGMCVVIATPSLQSSSPNLPVAVYDDISIVAMVLENPTINQDPNSASALRIPSGRIAAYIAEDLQCTIAGGSKLHAGSLRQDVDEQRGIVIWKVVVTASE